MKIIWAPFVEASGHLAIKCRLKDAYFGQMWWHPFRMETCVTMHFFRWLANQLFSPVACGMKQKLAQLHSDFSSPRSEPPLEWPVALHVKIWQPISSELFLACSTCCASLGLVHQILRVFRIPKD